MKIFNFVWDKHKAALNVRKHGVSFEEAETVFYDDQALEFFDLDHSGKEDRFVLLGMSSKARMLVVCHCVRESGVVIRIITARKATRRETEKYQKENL